MSGASENAGAVLAELTRLAEIAAGIVDGEEAKRIITEQAMHYIANPDPEHRFLSGDHYDVDGELFLRTKKLLTRLERLGQVTVNSSLWVPIPGQDAVTVAVHNGVNHRYYGFGMEKLPTPPEMREVFDSGEIRQVPPSGESDGGSARSLATALAPIRDSLGDVVAVAEFTSRVSGEPEAFN